MNSNLEQIRQYEFEQVAQIRVGGLCRIKSDEELQEFGYLPRVNPRCPQYVKLNQAPCTQTLNGDTGFMRLPASWQREVQNHNKAPLTFHKLTRKGSGWVNIQPWPAVRQLLFSTDKADLWNKVEVVKIVGGNAIIRTQSLTDRPIPYWWERDYLACRFTVIDINANVFYPDPPGVPMIFPLLRRKNKQLSIPLYKLEAV